MAQEASSDAMLTATESGSERPDGLEESGQPENETVLDLPILSGRPLIVKVFDYLSGLPPHVDSNKSVGISAAALINPVTLELNHIFRYCYRLKEIP